MFKFLSFKEMKVVIMAMEKQDSKAGEKIITEGEDGNCIYVVESGELDCFKLIGGEQKKVKEYF